MASKPRIRFTVEGDDSSDEVERVAIDSSLPVPNNNNSAHLSSGDKLANYSNNLDAERTQDDTTSVTSAASRSASRTPPPPRSRRESVSSWTSALDEDELIQPQPPSAVAAAHSMDPVEEIDVLDERPVEAAAKNPLFSKLAKANGHSASFSGNTKTASFMSGDKHAQSLGEYQWQSRNASSFRDSSPASPRSPMPPGSGFRSSASHAPTRVNRRKRVQPFAFFTHISRDLPSAGTAAALILLFPIILSIIAVITVELSSFDSAVYDPTNVRAMDWELVGQAHAWGSRQTEKVFAAEVEVGRATVPGLHLSAVFASDAGNVLTPDCIKRIRAFEDSFLDSSDYSNFCLRSADTGRCVADATAVASLTNYFYSSSLELRNESANSDDGYFGDRGSKRMQDFDTVVELLASLTADKNSPVRAFFGLGFGSDDSLKSAVTRSVYTFGVPLKGFTNVDDRRGEQESRFAEWIEPYADGFESDKELELYYSGSGLVRYLFSEVVVSDATLGSLSVVFVAMYMIYHTGSVFVSLMSLVHMTLSLPMALFVYLFVFDIQMFFGFNFLAIYVVLAVGADDVFVFTDVYAMSFLERSLKDAEYDMRLTWVFKRAVKAMMATSATTAVAFLGMAVSPLPTISAFGLFTTLVVLFNFGFAITYFPCIVAINHFTFERFDKTCGCFPCETPEPAPGSSVESFSGSQSRGSDEESAVDDYFMRLGSTQSVNISNSPTHLTRTTSSSPSLGDSNTTRNTSSMSSTAAFLKQKSVKELRGSGSSPLSASGTSINGNNNDGESESGGSESEGRRALPRYPSRYDNYELSRVQRFLHTTYTDTIRRPGVQISLLMMALTVVVCVVNYLPFYFATTTTSHQVFRSTHPVQKWFADHNEGFLSHPDDDYAEITLLFGAKELDREGIGRYDLHKTGKVVWDTDFNIADTSVQRHLVRVCMDTDRNKELVTPLNHSRVAVCHACGCPMVVFKNWIESSDSAAVRWVLDVADNGYNSNKTVHGMPPGEFPVAESDFMLLFNLWYFSSGPPGTPFNEVSSAYDAAWNSLKYSQNVGFYGGVQPLLPFVTAPGGGYPWRYADDTQLTPSNVTTLVDMVDEARAGDGVGVRYMSAVFNSTITVGSATRAESQAQIALWDEAVKKSNWHAKKADIRGASVLHASPEWVWSETQVTFIWSAVAGGTLSLLLSYGVLVVLTGNLLVALYATGSVVGVAASVLAMMEAVGWDFGAVESVGATVVIALATDYHSLFASAYMNSYAEARTAKVRDAVTEMGPAVLGGTATSVAATALLFFTTVQYFYKFGFCVCLSCLFSMLWSFGFFLPILAGGGPEGDAWQLLWRSDGRVWNPCRTRCRWKSVALQEEEEEAASVFNDPVLEMLMQSMGNTESRRAYSASMGSTKSLLNRREHGDELEPTTARTPRPDGEVSGDYASYSSSGSVSEGSEVAESVVAGVADPANLGFAGGAACVGGGAGGAARGGGGGGGGGGGFGLSVEEPETSAHVHTEAHTGGGVFGENDGVWDAASAATDCTDPGAGVGSGPFGGPVGVRVTAPSVRDEGECEDEDVLGELASDLQGWEGVAADFGPSDGAVAAASTVAGSVYGASSVGGDEHDTVGDLPFGRRYELDLSMGGTTGGFDVGAESDTSDAFDLSARSTTGLLGRSPSGESMGSS